MADEGASDFQLIPENHHATLFNVAFAPGEIYLSLGHILTGVQAKAGFVQHIPQWTHVFSINAVAAKAMLEGLTKALAQYERQFGAIPSVVELQVAAHQPG